ncbi:MAG: ABC transporter permease [Clostridia bacterium]|nr:ABC transporter permease [Clostridia bacterium]
MKKRTIVFGVLTLVCLAVALCLGAARRGVTEDDVRDYAAEIFRGSAEDKYAQLAFYCSEADYLTPDGIMSVKNQLESALTAESIDPAGKYLLAASVEKNVSVSRDAQTLSAIATVYFGDYFGLHPDLPLKGGYVDESDATTEFCVIDDYTAWRLFGSINVCGMDIEIDGKLYTVSAVLAADRGTYASYYGETPRVYILYSSAAMRDQNLCFTAAEAVLPNPITDFAYDMFSEAVSGYSEDVQVITGRFTPIELWENIKSMPSLGVMEGQSFPYYENVARIRETKCAMILIFEGVSWILAAVFLVTLIVLILYPISQKLKEKRLAKKRHAIY